MYKLGTSSVIYYIVFGLYVGPLLDKTENKSLSVSVPCVDTISNCKAYGIQNCNLTVYVPYMKSHCASFCNFCDGK